jgi:hypothetical protein
MWPGGHAVHAVSFFAWPDSTSWWCVCVKGTIEIDCGYTKRMLYAGIPQP